MKRKKILVITNSNSIWAQQLVEQVYLPLGFDVYITQFGGIQQKFSEFYKKNDVKLVSMLGNPLKKAASIIKFANENKGKIDQIDVQSPPRSIQRYILLIVKKILNVPMDISFWGSDILRINKTDSRKLTVLLKSARYINIPSDSIKNQFIKYFNDKYNDKLVRAYFGSPALSEIKKIGKDEIYPGINREKTVISIGHNGHPGQNHLKVIKALKNADIKIKESIFLVVHLAYGHTSEYAKEVEKALQESGIQFLLIDNHLTLSDTAKLRKSVNLSIHAQPSDALSGSIREALFAKTVVINNAAVKYKEFEDLNIDYLEFSDYEELPKIIDDYLNNRYHIDSEKNASAIEENFSWDSVRSDWKYLLKP